MSLLRALQSQVRSTAANGTGKPKRTTGKAAEDRSSRPASIATDFIKRIEQMDSKEEKSRTRGNSYLHVSTLVSAECPRKIVLEQLATEALTKRVFSPMRIVWALGRAAEHHVRQQYIQSVKASGVMGRWECPCGKLVQEPYLNVTVKCRTCDKPALDYNELLLMDHEARVCGSPDLVVAAADDLIVPVEIKSMNLTEFKERGGEDRSKPFRANAAHVGQVAGYHKMLSAQLGPARMATYALVLYVCKDHPKFGVSPYRAHFVAMNDESVQHMLTRMWATAESVWSARGDERLPERLPVCERPTSSIAKGCACLGPCFAPR